MKDISKDFVRNVACCGLIIGFAICQGGCSRPRSPSVSTLVAKLNEEDYEVRIEALDELKKLGPKAKPAIPTLLKLLKDQDSRIRVAAAVGLGTIGPDAKEAAPALISHLHDDKGRFVASVCAQALARIGVRDNKTLTALKEALLDGNTAIQIQAAEALTALYPDNQDAITTVIKLLKDKDPHTRDGAAYSLGSPRGCFKSTKITLAIPALVATLKDSDEAVRQIAAQSLGRICEHSESVVPALIERVNNEKRALARIFAIQALGEYGPEAKAAIPALTHALKDGDQEVRDFAAQSIDHIKTWKIKRGLKGKEEEGKQIKKGMEDAIKKNTWFWERW